MTARGDLSVDGGTAARRIAFTGTLGALAAVSATAVDVALPAQPGIAAALGAEPGAGAMLVGAYIGGFGVGQFAWGILSDRFGRRAPLLAGLAGFVAASLVCAGTGSFAVLLWARFAQGLAGGAAPVIARAIARDQGGGTRSARLIATMTALLGLAPLLAPMIGSALLAFGDWRWIFWFLFAFGVVLMASTALAVPESLPPAQRRPLSPRGMTRDAATLLRTRDFLSGAAMTTSAFAGYAALLAIGATVAAVPYGISPEAFGPLFGVAALGFVAGSSGVRQALPRFGIERVLTTGAAVSGVVGVVLLALTLADPGLVPLWAVVTVYVLVFGIMIPCGTAWALEPAGRIAGFASSVLGMVQTLGGTAGAALAAALYDGSHRSLTAVMGGAALLCLAARLAARRRP